MSEVHLELDVGGAHFQNRVTLFVGDVEGELLVGVGDDHGVLFYACSRL